MVLNSYFVFENSFKDETGTIFQGLNIVILK